MTLPPSTKQVIKDLACYTGPERYPNTSWYQPANGTSAYVGTPTTAANNANSLAISAATSVVHGSGPPGNMTTYLGCPTPSEGSGDTVPGLWMSDMQEFGLESALRAYDQESADFLLFYTPQLSNLAATFDLAPTGAFVSIHIYNT